MPVSLRTPMLHVPGLAPHEVEAALCVLAVARALDVPLRSAFGMLACSGVMLRMPDGERRTFRRLDYASVSRWTHACLVHEMMSTAGDSERRAA